MSKLRAPARTTAAAVSMLILSSGLAACGGSSSGSSKKVALVAYSTLQPAYDEMIHVFKTTPEGKGVTFTESYGPSGEQSRAVVNGLKADVVNFSLEPDMTKLVKAGLVPASWNQNATHGFVTDSVVAFVVRGHNPKHITSWSDLIKPGVKVVTPNPFTSGSARWNIMAAYGAQLKEGKTPAQAQEYLTQMFHHVVSQDSSARNALVTFLGGRGDVLLYYESDAITTEQNSAPIEHVIPADTILIQNPIAVLSKGNTAEGQKFVNYLLSPAGQALWLKMGYRPVISGVPGTNAMPTPKGLFTIDTLGGWTQVAKQFFDPEKGLVAKIEQSLGVSTAK